MLHNKTQEYLIFLYSNFQYLIYMKWFEAVPGFLRGLRKFPDPDSPGQQTIAVKQAEAVQEIMFPSGSFSRIFVRHG